MFQFVEVNILEIWDAYLIDGTLANQDLVRGEPIPKGLYHLVSEILVRHIDVQRKRYQKFCEKMGYIQ